MATPTIPNGEEYFFPVIYSGNGQGQRVGKFVPFTDSGTIANSCMFDDGDSAYLSKTYGSAGTSQKKFTFSCWVKRGFVGNDFLTFFNVGASSGSYFVLGFNSGTYANAIQFYNWTGSAYTLRRITNRTFEDTSKFYHIVVAIDTTQATASDRVKLYVDGDEITSFQTSVDPSLNLDTLVGSADSYYVGSDSSNHFDGYLAEVNYVDGTALGPETFGVTDTSTGRWIPKTLTGITYGTNGFRLKFQDSSALGDDTSGNGNDLTSTNLATTDQRTDSPTNLFPTIRAYNPSYSQTFSEGNLQHATTGTNVGYPVVSTLRPKGSGKFYAECRISTTPGGNTIALGCYAQEDLHNYSSGNAYPGNANYGSGLWIAGTNYLRWNGQTGFVNSPTFTFSAGDVIGLALDLDTGLLSFYDDDNGLIGSVTYDRTKSACFGGMSNTSVTFIWNFGDNPTFNGNETAGGNTDGDGNGNFFKSVPTGFKVLKQDNMAETAKGVSGLVWTKNRDAADNHQLYDSSRGKQLVLASNATSAEATVTDGLQRFLAGGQQIEDSDAINTAGESFVSWNWVANGGTTASNTDGSITSTVQANTTAGFSIVKYTGTGSNATIGHGLSLAPSWIMVKNLSQGDAWKVYHHKVSSDPQTDYLVLNTTGAVVDDATVWNDTAPTSTVFSIGTHTDVNTSSENYVAYCWHEVDGFSKFGTYKGNGSTDGSMIYTGFRPSFVLIKSTSTQYWMTQDSTRWKFNPTDKPLFPANTDAESGLGAQNLDFLSNGFKCRGTSATQNSSSHTYIYMAFAEHPFVGDGTNPVTAR